MFWLHGLSIFIVPILEKNMYTLHPCPFQDFCAWNPILPILYQVRYNFDLKYFYLAGQMLH